MFQKFILFLKYLSYKRHFRNLAKSHFSKTTFDEIFKYDIYKLKKIIKKINLSSDNFRVLDIGAHHGFYSFYLQEIINYEKKEKLKNIDFHLIEPDKNNFEILKKVFTKKNYFIYNDLIGNEKKIYNFQFESFNTAGHIFIEDLEKFKKRKPTYIKKGIIKELKPGLKTINLKKLINEIGYIKFAKIDCEGAEHEAIPEAIEEISNNIENLFIEIHRSHKEREVIYNLLSSQYPTVIELSDSMKMAFFSKNILHIN